MSVDFANIMYDEYIKKWEIPTSLFLKQKYAKEKKEYDDAKKRVQKIINSYNKKNWLKKELTEKEFEYFQEIWEDKLRRESELYN